MLTHRSLYSVQGLPCISADAHAWLLAVLGSCKTQAQTLSPET